MDWRKISKALAGAAAGAAGGTGTAAIAIPADIVLPWYGYVAVAVVNAALAFAAVYWAPANATA